MPSGDLVVLFGENYFWLFWLFFARIMGFLSIHPVFSINYIGRLTRTALAMVISLLLLPMSSHLSLSNNVLTNIALMVLNIAYGCLLGYLLALPLWLIESCGKIIDLQRGEQMGGAINQLTKNPSSSVSKLLTQAFMAYFVLNQGVLFLFKLLFTSFFLLPVNQIIPAIDSKHIKIYLNLFYQYTYWMVILILPIILILLLVDLGLGLISSFIPQLNVTIISMPIKSIIALLVLSIYIGALFHDLFNKYVYQLLQIF